MAEIDWSQLHDEHGPSTDLRDLIAELGPDENSPEWRELWLRVYHQGSLYSASPYVLARYWTGLRVGIRPGR